MFTSCKTLRFIRLYLLSSSINRSVILHVCRILHELKVLQQFEKIYLISLPVAGLRTFSWISLKEMSLNVRFFFITSINGINTVVLFDCGLYEAKDFIVTSD